MPKSNSPADLPVDKSVGGVDNSLEVSRVLGVFAKEPVSGQVKTRLSPPLSMEQAAELYSHALQETIDNMSGGDFDLVICHAGDEAYFRRAFSGCTLYEQQGDDLGARMDSALRHFLSQGYRQAMLIGSDSPDLPRDMVERGFAELEHSALVLAPAHDGGYVLIGESCHHPCLFENMPWSSEDVLSQTLQRADAQGIDYRLLPEWDDLDDLEALRRFLQRSPDSTTAKYLRELSVPECAATSV